MSSCCGRRLYTAPVACPARAPCCTTSTLSVPYTAEALSLESASAFTSTLSPTMQVVAPCPSAVSLIFTGHLQNVSLASLTVSVVLQYWNVLTPSIVTANTVPVTATLVEDAYVPVAVTLNVTLPAGTYVVRVSVTGDSGDIGEGSATVNAAGTLNALVARAGGPIA